MAKNVDPQEPPKDTAGELSEELRDFVSKTANAAQSAHSSRMNRVFDKKISELGEAIDAKIAAVLQKAPVASDSTKDEDKGSLKTQYEARLKELESRMATERRAAEEAKQATRTKEERYLLTEALRKAGAGDDRVRGAAALLYSEDKRVSTSESGEVVMSFKRDGYVEQLPLLPGVTEWLETDEGRHYLPARNVKGSGARGGSPITGNAGRGDKKAEAAATLQRAILSSMGAKGE